MGIYTYFHTCTDMYIYVNIHKHSHTHEYSHEHSMSSKSFTNTWIFTWTQDELEKYIAKEDAEDEDSEDDGEDDARTKSLASFEDDSDVRYIIPSPTRYLSLSVLIFPLSLLRMHTRTHIPSFPLWLSLYVSLTITPSPTHSLTHAHIFSLSLWCVRSGAHDFSWTLFVALALCSNVIAFDHTH